MYARDGIVNSPSTSDRHSWSPPVIGIGLPSPVRAPTAGAEISYEYDGGAVEGVDKLDENLQAGCLATAGSAFLRRIVR